MEIEPSDSGKSFESELNRLLFHLKTPYADEDRNLLETLVNNLVSVLKTSGPQKP